MLASKRFQISDFFPINWKRLREGGHPAPVLRMMSALSMTWKHQGKAVGGYMAFCRFKTPEGRL